MKSRILNTFIKNAVDLDITINSKNEKDYDIIKTSTRESANANIVLYILDLNIRKVIAIVKVPRLNNNIKYLTEENNKITEILNDSSQNLIKKQIPNTILIKLDDTALLFQKFEEGTKLVQVMQSKDKVIKWTKKIMYWYMNFLNSRTKVKVLESDALIKKTSDILINFKNLYPNVYSKFNKNTLQFFYNTKHHLVNERVTLIGQHNDFNAHNLIINNLKSKFSFSIIDWEDYENYCLPVIDLNHYFISNSGLLSKKSKMANYNNYFINDSYYKSLYLEVIQQLSDLGFISKQAFKYLTPYYFLIMCINLNKQNREQTNTLEIWVKRMEIYIASIEKEIR
jgi:hypothetical protein